jgi:hypothetical protein
MILAHALQRVLDVTPGLGGTPFAKRGRSTVERRAAETSINDRFLHPLHHPCVDPLDLSSNRTVCAVNPDVSQFVKRASLSNGRHARARVARGLPRVDPRGVSDDLFLRDYYDS